MSSDVSTSLHSATTNKNSRVNRQFCESLVFGEGGECVRNNRLLFLVGGHLPLSLSVYTVLPVLVSALIEYAKDCLSVKRVRGWKKKEGMTVAWRGCVYRLLCSTTS